VKIKDALLITFIALLALGFFVTVTAVQRNRVKDLLMKVAQEAHDYGYKKGYAAGDDDGRIAVLNAKLGKCADAA